MDLLHSRYASPMEFMHLYIEQGRFGEFVSEILALDEKRKQEEIEKDNDNKLWSAYINSMSDKPFTEWKKGLYERKQPISLEMSDAQVEDVKQNARGILSRFSPS